MIQSIQKAIKVGSSWAITIPAKEARRIGVTKDTEFKVTLEPLKKKDDKHDKLMDEYQEFVQEYGTTLKNLADK